MPKASIILPDGTSVIIEGTSEEVAKMLILYGGAGSDKKAPTTTSKKDSVHKAAATKRLTTALKSAKNDDSPDLPAIINHIKNCDLAENIETKVLDKPSQVNKVLLPLFIVHEYMDNRYGLTSGDVNKITTDLGVPVSRPNSSRTLSGSAAKYVIGDKIRKPGQAVHYKLSRRGVQYLNDILSGE
jgi:hypothetical protein